MTSWDLIEVATWLASDDKIGRAKHAYRRRAISTAYYALFRALAELCADELAGGSRDDPEWEIVFRSLDHAAAKNALIKLAREGGDEMIGVIAGAFRELQNARHDADYGATAHFSAEAAARWLDVSVSAITSLGRLPAYERRSLAVRLLFRQRPELR